MRRTTFIGAGLIGGILMASGCREGDAPPYYPKNLGSGRQTLMPVPVGFYQQPDKFITGRAEMKPFDFEREPGAAPPNGPTSDQPSAGASTPVDEAKIKEGVQRTVDDFQYTITQMIEKLEPQEGMEYFFVPEQRAAAKESFNGLGRFLGKIKKLIDLMEQRTPGSGQMMRQAMGPSMMAGLRREESLATVQIQKIEILGPDEVSVTTNSSKNPITRMKLIEGEWCIDDPSMATDDAQDQAQLAQIEGLFDQLIQAYETGNFDPQMLQAIQAQMMSMVSQQNQGENQNDNSGGEDNNP